MTDDFEEVMRALVQEARQAICGTELEAGCKTCDLLARLADALEAAQEFLQR